MEDSMPASSLLFPLLDEANEPAVQCHYDVQRTFDALPYHERSNQESFIPIFKPRPMTGTPWKPSGAIDGHYAPQESCYHLPAATPAANTNRVGAWQSQAGSCDMKARMQPSPTTTLYDFGYQEQDARSMLLASPPQRWHYGAPNSGADFSTPARPAPYRPCFTSYHTQHLVAPVATTPTVNHVTPRKAPMTQEEWNSATAAAKSTLNSSYNYPMMHNDSSTNNPAAAPPRRPPFGAAVNHTTQYQNFATSPLQESAATSKTPSTAVSTQAVATPSRVPKSPAVSSLPAPKVNDWSTPPTDRSRQKYLCTPSRAGSITSSATSSSNSSSNNVVPPTTSATSMIPQNLRNDPHRHAKIKTELCLHFLRGTKCPFGERCNYAHGTDELKFKTLHELEKHGIIDDASTYRIHPCFTHVSTGTCPFGQRCLSIHDPRVTGNECYPCWLPHNEAPVNNLPTLINVDKWYHERLRLIRQSNPLIHTQHSHSACGGHGHDGTNGNGNVSNERLEDIEWKDTYKRVVNMEDDNLAFQHKKSLPQSSIGHKNVSESQRLQIAVCFLCEDKDGGAPRYRSYIYQPSHLVYNELCMILQAKFFRLFPSTNSVKCITKEEYHAHRTPWGNSTSDGSRCANIPYCPNDVIVVYEICFGPVGRHEGCRSVRLCFDIAHSDIVSCSPQQVKKFKKKCKGLATGAPGDAISSTNDGKFPAADGFRAGSPAPSFARPSATASAPSFDIPAYPSFVFAQPMDDAAHDLYVDMVVHRIQVLRHQASWGRKEGSTMMERKRLELLEVELKKRFFSLSRHFQSILWPINVGREDLDDNNDIPPVRGPYEVMKSHCDAEKHSGTHAAESIWASFTSNIPTFTRTTMSEEADNGPVHQESESLPRLSVFRHLALGKNVPGSERIPLPRIKYVSSAVEGPQCLSTHVWKSILSLDSENAERPNDWDILKDHYNSTSGTVGPDSPKSSNNEDSDKLSGSPSFRGHDLPLSARALAASSSSGSDTD